MRTIILLPVNLASSFIFLVKIMLIYVYREIVMNYTSYLDICFNLPLNLSTLSLYFLSLSTCPILFLLTHSISFYTIRQSNLMTLRLSSIWLNFRALPYSPSARCNVYNGSPPPELVKFSNSPPWAAPFIIPPWLRIWTCARVHVCMWCDESLPKPLTKAITKNTSSSSEKLFYYWT